jgi:dTDP-4-amino-4,6-dideoxygalactose transaminase
VDSCSAWHLYVIRLQLDRIPRTRAEVFREMRARGIGVNVHYIPVPRHPYYARLGFDASRWPEAERYYAEAISIPLHARLTDTEQDEVVAALRASVGIASP